MAGELREMEGELEAIEEKAMHSRREVEEELRRERGGHEPDRVPNPSTAPSRIEHDVRAALDGDPRIKHPELIAVSADEIGAVVLRGTVEGPHQHQVAVRDARQVDGVFDVIADGLTVRPLKPKD
jgi:osmotically-inducible protein OsmY